jgi:hypothetical protein
VPENTALIHPATGEAVDLAGAAPAELGRTLDELAVLTDALREFRRDVELELVRRIDATGRRTAELGGYKLETNAPVEETYSVEDVERELRPLVDRGIVPRETLEALVVYPKPKPPEPRVDKRVLNSLKLSDNAELVRALGAARRRTNARRTLKIVTRPIEGTVEDDR